MKLRPRLIATALVVALPLAIVLFLVHTHLRDRDRLLTLERFVTSQLTDDGRARCESNPNWFLAGPRMDRPRPEVLAMPDADVNAPRPPTDPLPLEYFAYDEQFSPLSSAGPRFPADMRQAIRAGGRVVSADFSTPQGTGLQMAAVTGWERSTCVYLLFRLRPTPAVWFESGWVFLGLLSALLVTAIAVAGPTFMRVRRLGVQARQSADQEYRSTIDVGGRDELSALAFAFNEASADIQRRATDVRDREDSLRRYIASATESVTSPLVQLNRQLGQGGADALKTAVIQTHSLAMRLQNLSTAATLRMSLESPGGERVDLKALVETVVARQAAFARASGVTVQVAAPAAATIPANAALLDQAVANLLDNAIRYNRAGGQVFVALDRTADGRFSLRVADDGPGAPDEVLAKLNANRRFRGDEGKAGRAGELGLGLAIVREVSDRFNIRWAFRTNARGQFEAELTGAA